VNDRCAAGKFIEGMQNAVAHSRRATKNLEWANVFLFFLHFMLYVHQCSCCMVKLMSYVCATKILCALLTFPDNFAPLVLKIKAYINPMHVTTFSSMFADLLQSALASHA